MNPEKFQSIDVGQNEAVKKTLANLEKSRNAWSNHIPAIDISTGHFKVRHVWFQNILFDIADAEKLHEQGVIEISPQLQLRIEQFIKHVDTDEFKNRMTTKEDMDAGDSILDELIEILKSKI
ncbi:MAG: hypothetical protein WC766_01360 [Patescibacteria group bacterium]|jgi:hypothetical protein